MADITNLIESKNLNGEDLGANLHQATIKAVTIDEFDNGPKAVVEFVEFEKRLIANKTQTKTLANLFGTDTAGWIGQKVQIFGEQLSSGKFAGRWTVKILQAQPAVQQMKPAQPAQQQSQPAQPVEEVLITPPADTHTI